ncbi:MAG: hypothetical protein UY23_C0006G0044 [Candidatus Jorgensenbacteria bacterium GW2011_GWA1_48_11]|uniref:Uncharacterized protein n=1 Tax=Candidatus Jorgensenbacteria bacterium GW2011_GWA1_48_11 TaxID=1618660 RepID=A0A0G1X8X9_9BACT|nr:MAG: hypothetical protein UY23_C0006G0044 [Candidatus Jorgensenbacteria bacterium GW2011_GWA1_48_11]
MPPINHYLSRKDWLEASWKKIAKSEKPLALLVTPYERRNIVMRAAVRDCLDSGKGIRQIARELQLSLQTVNAVKKALSEKNYRSYRERGKSERQKRVFSSYNNQVKERFHGRPARTKYGKVNLP